MPALDYARVARLYDEYCVFADDIPFLVSQATSCREPVLELMAGTGRLSRPLVDAGVSLTCLDSSVAMLAILRRQLATNASCRIVCADVRQLPLEASFGCIVLPFQGLSELTAEADQRRLVQAAAERLTPRGIFVCTLHNPRLRLRTLDGCWQEVGVFARPAGGLLRLAIRAQLIPGTRIVEGEQRLTLRDDSGASGEEIVVHLRFSLPEPDALVRWADEAGLALRSCWGDFAGAPWDERSSPLFVAVFGRPTAASRALKRGEGASR